jgi:hypothetical protein
MYRAWLISISIVTAACAGCGSDGDAPDPIFPVDYAATYQEVRNCRFSLDHDLVRMRIVVSPDALAPYMNRTDPFPTGAIVLKEEFDGSDEDCTGDLIGFTVMRKLDVGTAAADLDWEWQETDEAFVPVPANVANIPRCVMCHTDCGTIENGGYDGTCANFP